jgi:DNA-binding NarL/FixJ family response regulator
MADNKTIILADDHPIFRFGLRQMIEREFGPSVVAEAEDGLAALRLIEEYRPEVAVLDLDMPEMDGFTVTEEIIKRKLPTKVVILSLHKDELHINRAVDLGVSGYVIKDGAAYEIVSCIKAVLSECEYFSPVLSSVLLNRSRRLDKNLQEPGLADLTPTERRILYLLSELKTSKTIADELHISPRTVDNHRAHICSKLGLSGSHALVKYALEHRGELR